MASRNVRAEQASVTRAKILTIAERMFAEHGLFAVSSRQISEAAGQGNNAAVGYHFGTKTDLVRAIIRKHTDDIESRRQQAVDQAGDSAEVRDWVACLVFPLADHLADLGPPTWYARFGAQVLADPVLHQTMIEGPLSSSPLRTIVDGFNRCLREVPADVRVERNDISRHLIMQVCADRERALAEGTVVSRSSWQEAATGLVDAIAGIWLAPVTSKPLTSPQERNYSQKKG